MTAVRVGEKNNKGKYKIGKYRKQNKEDCERHKNLRCRSLVQNTKNWSHPMGQLASVEEINRQYFGSEEGTQLRVPFEITTLTENFKNILGQVQT